MSHTEYQSLKQYGHPVQMWGGGAVGGEPRKLLLLQFKKCIVHDICDEVPAANLVIEKNHAIPAAFPRAHCAHEEYTGTVDSFCVTARVIASCAWGINIRVFRISIVTIARLISSHILCLFCFASLRRHVGDPISGFCCIMPFRSHVADAIVGFGSIMPFRSHVADPALGFCCITPFRSHVRPAFAFSQLRGFPGIRLFGTVIAQCLSISLVGILANQPPRSACQTSPHYLRRV